MKSQGKIAFSMPSAARWSERRVHIEITDEMSGTRFLELEMTAADFALATVGDMGYTDCRFELFPVNVGKVAERKVKLVPGETVEDALSALSQFEIDGWIAYRPDIGNYHKRAKIGNGWHVSFTRFVEIKKAGE